MTQFPEQTDMSKSVEKSQLRTKYLNQRKEMPVELRQALSVRMTERLVQWLATSLKSSAFEATPIVGLYSAIRSEPDLSSFHSELMRNGFRVAYPRVENEGLSYYLVQSMNEMQRGAYKILEPSPLAERKVVASELAVLCIPGVAFTQNGIRLGYGGGYFDKLLADDAVIAIRVGVTFTAQCVVNLPIESHDVRMHYLLTETSVTKCIL